MDEATALELANNIIHNRLHPSRAAELILAASRPAPGHLRASEGVDMRIDPSRSWDTGYNRVFTVPTAAESAKGGRQ